MIAWFHEVVVRVSSVLGAWFFSMMAIIIAAGYYVFIPKRVIASSRVYRALYPSRSFAYHLLCVWRQYHGFTRVILDRMLLVNYGKIKYNSQGMEFLDRALGDGTGGIIVMSHMGNWDVAAHLLRGEGVPLMIYMGARDREQIEKMQKDNLRDRGVRIVAAGKEGGSPFDVIEGLNFLQKGGLVAMTGDLLWRQGQRSVEADFLGRRVKLPVVPYILALKTGAPLLFFFSFRQGPGEYSFIIRDPQRLVRRPGGRAAEEAVVKEAAQKYADILAEELSRHPFEWYHFDDFFGGKAGPRQGPGTPGAWPPGA